MVSQDDNFSRMGGPDACCRLTNLIWGPDPRVLLALHRLLIDGGWRAPDLQCPSAPPPWRRLSWRRQGGAPGHRLPGTFWCRRKRALRQEISDGCCGQWRWLFHLLYCCKAWDERSQEANSWLQAEFLDLVKLSWKFCSIFFCLVIIWYIEAFLKEQCFPQL